MTSFPRSTSARTVLRPIPRPPPVTRETRPEPFARWVVMPQSLRTPRRGARRPIGAVPTTECRSYLEVSMPIVKELPSVPAERTLKVIGGRWKVYILYFLFERPHRLSELRRIIPDVSQKVLVQQLREMEEHGIVDR